MPLIAEIGRPSWRQGFARSAAESAYPELWSGCVADWTPLLGPTGIKLREHIKQRHGTLRNMTVGSGWVLQRGYHGLNFNYGTASGTGVSHVEVPDSASVGGMDSASIAIWYYADAVPSNNAAIYYESTTTGGFSRFAVFHLSSGNVFFVVRDTATGAAFTCQGTMSTGRWHAIVGTYNSRSNNQDLWLNGSVLASNTTSKGAIHSGTPADPIGIGAFVVNSGSSYSTDGVVGAIRIWDRELQAGEIATLNSMPNAPFVPRRRTVFNVPAVAPTGAGFPFQYYYSTGSL